MKIETDVQINKVHRIGKGTNRAMLVCLKTSDEKGKIYSCVKNLKNVQNEKGKKYQIKDQLPGKFADRANRQKSLLHENNLKPLIADKLQMNLFKGELSIGNAPYKKLVNPPTARDVLKSTEVDRVRWRKVKLVPGNITMKNKCSFQGYSVVAAKIDTIWDAYLKLREIPGDAQHIVCAYRLPGQNFAVLQDYCDDQEHFSGGALLRMLKSAEIFNRAVFVVRYYGGEHLGPSRHQAFVEAAQSAITHDPCNRFTKENQTPCPKAKPTDAAGSTATANTAAPKIDATPVADNNSLTAQSFSQEFTHFTKPSAPSVRGHLPSGPLRPLSLLYN